MTKIEYPEEMVDKIFPIGIIIAKVETPPSKFEWKDIVIGNHTYLQRKS